MLHYPDFNKELEIHTDSSNYQMGVVISQKWEIGDILV